MHEQHHQAREPRHHGHTEHHQAHHQHHHQHHHVLYLRIMPHVRRVFHEMGHRHMNPAHLDHMTNRVMEESGMLHDLPPGHTRESMHDFVRILLLAIVDGMVPVDGMALDQNEPAAEAFHPFVPFPWGFGFPWAPYPFFFPGRHPGRGRPGRRPHGGHGRR